MPPGAIDRCTYAAGGSTCGMPGKPEPAIVSHWCHDYKMVIESPNAVAGIIRCKRHSRVVHLMNMAREFIEAHANAVAMKAEREAAAAAYITEIDNLVEDVMGALMPDSTAAVVAVYELRRRALQGRPRQ